MFLGQDNDFFQLNLDTNVSHVNIRLDREIWHSYIMLSTEGHNDG